MTITYPISGIKQRYRIADDDIDNQNGWDDDVDDDIREQNCGGDVDEEVNVIVEAHVEGETSEDL
jgi:hypothetical protein